MSLYDMSGISGMTKITPMMLASRLARVETTVPYRLGGGNFARTDFLPIDASGVIDGRLNLGSASALDFSGIMSPNVVDGAFSVACPSDSSAIVYWDGTNSSRVFMIRRPDQQGNGLPGTSTTIPPNNLTITGLTASAKYTAYAYWSPDNGCGLGFSPGDTGTPLIAFSASATATTLKQAQANQSLVGREPVGTFNWTQPAGGGTSPGGPPADPPAIDPGTCVKLGTHIEPLGPWEYSTRNHKWEDWIFIEAASGRNLSCTPDHPLFHAEKGKQDAELFKIADWIITNRGEEKIARLYTYKYGCTKVQVMMQKGHLFWANGFLSHNIKLPQQ